MKIIFVSNYFNHHQKPFCEEMYQKLGADFAFVATSEMRKERIKLGYAQDDSPEYVILAHKGKLQRNMALDLINEADVVIAGSAPNGMLKKRIKLEKIVFRYSERIYRKKTSFIRKFYHFLKLHQRDYWKKNIYMLCAGAYTAYDYESIGMYKKRTLKWGYFPEVKEYDINKLISQKKSDTILWCGRFLDLKHAEDAIYVAYMLKKNNYKFCLNLIGTGIMEKELIQLVKKYDLEDVVHFLGSMSPEQVRTYMEESGIYLFTSDRQEGWGAVLNESMNSGCAVIASHFIGSVPYLVINNVNGYIYESRNVDMIFEKVKFLLEHPEEQRRLGKAAYETIVTEWNAKNAAKRFLCLTEGLLKKEKHLEIFDNGPCSQAEPICDDFCLR